MLHELIVGMFPQGGIIPLLLEIVLYFLILVIVPRVIIEVFLRIGARITSKTANTLDDAVIAAVRSIIMPVILFVAFSLTIVNFLPNAVLVDYPVSELLIYVGIFLGAWVANRSIGGVVGWYDNELQTSHKGQKKELFSFVRKMIGVGIYAIAFIIMLDRAGIQIAPLLAGLGVAGLAVALALQGTLSNLFAGMHILADKPFRVGQFILVENDPTKAGVVEEIGWRTTRIRLPNNTVLIIPNSKLAESEVINTSVPSSPIIVVIKVSASYADETEKVEMALREAVGEAMKNEAIFDKSFAPIIRANAFLDSGIEYAIVVQVKEYMLQYGARGALVKAVEKAFKKYKVTIPFPTRTVHLEK